jgi:RNA polymerase sigma factor (sigma-70 family)
VSLSAQELKALCAQHTRFVRSIAGKLKRSLPSEIEFEDLVAYGMIGLLEAVERYDPSRGANFMTFSYRRVRGEMLNGLHVMGWLKPADYRRKAFFVQPFDGVEEFVPDPHSLADEDLIAAQEHARVRKTLLALLRPVKAVIFLRFYCDHTLDFIGKRLGVTRSWVHKLEQRGLEHMHRQLKVA